MAKTAVSTLPDAEVGQPAPAGASEHPLPASDKSIAIFIVAYNAAGTLRSVLDRIPQQTWDRVEEVFVFDDSSQDDTFLVGLGYRELHNKKKLTVIRNRENQGYGGNQILGYKYAIEKGYDIVALLHGDGQYAPEALPQLLAPLERGEADAVFGSRMMRRGDALKGGMPLYKYVGNKVLTTFENALLGMNLSEFHSGYRLYSTAALKDIPFERNTHDFHFDTQIIIQMQAAGKRIVELPIPTYYGDEICYVNGMSYARNVAKSVFEYQLHNLSIRHAPEYEVHPSYSMKRSPLSSHSQLMRLVGPPSQRVLDVGCGRGELAHALEEAGHTVTATDFEPPAAKLREFFQSDLRDGLALPEDRVFDVILLADVLEHMSEPERLLEDAARHLAPNGRLLVSLPNAVHWSVRLQVGLGKFDYANKGIMDRGHLRFFTRSSAERMFRSCGLTPRSHSSTPVPWENVIPDVFGGYPREQVEKLDHAASNVWGNLFAYQHVFELVRG